jgi:hypothetical protein
VRRTDANNVSGEGAEADESTELDPGFPIVAVAVHVHVDMDDQDHGHDHEASR